MTVAIVGGLDRLARHYGEIADEHDDLQIKVFNSMKRSVAKKISSADGVILCTNLVSHSTAREVYRLARDKGLKLVPCHRGSISAMRECVALLADVGNGCNSAEGACSRCPLGASDSMGRTSTS